MKDNIINIKDYKKLDGRNNQSKIEKITLGKAIKEENQAMEIGLQYWVEEEGDLVLDKEIAIHQIIDDMLILASSLRYFQDAYRHDKLIDKREYIDKIGVQGAYIPLEFDWDNENLEEDVLKFDLAIKDMGELLGDRIRALNYILDDLIY